MEHGGKNSGNSTRLHSTQTAKKQPVEPHSPTQARRGKNGPTETVSSSENHGSPLGALGRAPGTRPNAPPSWGEFVTGVSPPAHPAAHVRSLNLNQPTHSSVRSGQKPKMEPEKLEPWPKAETQAQSLLVAEKKTDHRKCIAQEAESETPRPVSASQQQAQSAVLARQHPAAIPHPLLFATKQLKSKPKWQKAELCTNIALFATKQLQSKPKWQKAELCTNIAFAPKVETGMPRHSNRAKPQNAASALRAVQH